MTVMYKNKLYSLNMTYFLFQSLQKSNPDYEVELLSICDSSYKEKTKVKMQDLEDWSVIRNLNALGK